MDIFSFLSYSKWTNGGVLDKWSGNVSDLSDSDKRAIMQIVSMSENNKVDYLVGLEELVKKYPNQPFFLVRLADIYFTLKFFSGASKIVKHVGDLIGEHTDINFDKWAAHVIEMYDKDKKYQESLYFNNNLLNTIYAKKLSSYNSYKIKEPVSLMSQVREGWLNLSKINEKDITEAYARLLCIETNELEDVFHLGGESLIRLVKGGFFVGAIQHVEPYSELRDKNKIVSVLRDVQCALDIIINWVFDPNSSFSPDLCLNIHKVLIRSNRIKTIVDYETKLPYKTLIPVGEWREKTVFASRQNGHIIFHPFTHIKESMEILSDMINSIINKIKQSNSFDNPYSFAAWIHHSLISIHPFEDGNGRMTRLISSIPLCLVGLPPIYISLENKIEYFRALAIADSTLDIGPLAEMFAKESINGINKVSRIIPLLPPDNEYAFNSDLMQTQTM